jgi:hypothetical protein
MKMKIDWLFPGFDGTDATFCTGNLDRRKGGFQASGRSAGRCNEHRCGDKKMDVWRHRCDQCLAGGRHSRFQTAHGGRHVCSDRIYAVTAPMNQQAGWAGRGTTNRRLVKRLFSTFYCDDQARLARSAVCLLLTVFSLTANALGRLLLIWDVMTARAA